MVARAFHTVFAHHVHHLQVSFTKWQMMSEQLKAHMISFATHTGGIDLSHLWPWNVSSGRRPTTSPTLWSTFEASTLGGIGIRQRVSTAFHHLGGCVIWRSVGWSWKKTKLEKNVWALPRFQCFLLTECGTSGLALSLLGDAQNFHSYLLGA